MHMSPHCYLTRLAAPDSSLSENRHSFFSHTCTCAATNRVIQTKSPWRNPSETCSELVFSLSIMYKSAINCNLWCNPPRWPITLAIDNYAIHHNIHHPTHLRFYSSHKSDSTLPPPHRPSGRHLPNASLICWMAGERPVGRGNFQWYREKSSINSNTNRKPTTRFPMSLRWSS